jgi:hypothetical protein
MVKYIFVLTELTIATLFYLNANYEKSKVLTGFLCLPRGLTSRLLVKSIEALVSIDAS